MKTPLRLITGIFGVLGLMLCIDTSFAGSAIWDLNPASGDWNTATNWTPTAVPNGAADTATFDLSSTTNVSISANTEVNGITFTSAAPVYTIRGGSELFADLTLSGVGITNNSAVAQNFVTVGAGRIYFTNNASAGTSTIFTNYGYTIFLNNSTAGNATFINNSGSTFLEHSSTAGNATFINNGGFQGSYPGTFITSDAPDAISDATFINNGGPFAGARGGSTEIWLGVFGSPALGHPVFINNGGAADGAFGGYTLLQSAVPDDSTFTNNGGLVSGAFGGSTVVWGPVSGTVINNGATVSGANGGSTIFEFGEAGNATLINNGATVTSGGGGLTVFKGSTFAGSATLIASGGTVAGAEGGAIFFRDDSTGGTSRVELFGNGALDISFHNVPKPQPRYQMQVGSIEGDGNVFLGANNLAVGSSNLSTIFSGVIQDGGANGGTGGSLTKIGSGTLVLAGVNTYSGNTTIKQGVLQVDGSISSNTFVKRRGTLAGLGTIQGNVTNAGAGTVNPGNAAPGTLTISGNYTQTRNATLMIDIAGTNSGQVSLLDVFGGATLDGMLDPALQNGFVPLVSEEFVFLDYGSFSGSLFMHDYNIDGTMEHWKISYEPGHAVLTVAAGNVPVPDQASTLLLMTLSLLGLVGLQANLRRS